MLYITLLFFENIIYFFLGKAYSCELAYNTFLQFVETIEDKKNNSFTEITNSNYTFANDTAYSEDRFVVHFEKGVGLPEGMIADATNYDAYFGQGQLNFIFQAEDFKPTTASLYSLQGKLISTFDINEPTTSVVIPNIATGIYLLALESDVTGARKLYINK